MKLAVHRADHQIQPPQDRVRKIEPTVFQNVHLDALEDAEARQLRVEDLDLVYLPQQAPAIEPADHGQALGMLG